MMQRTTSTLPELLHGAMPRPRSRCFRPVFSLFGVPSSSRLPVLGGTRAFSVNKSDTQILSFDKVEAPKDARAPEQCLVICHGLFGSKQNWRSLSKTFAARLGMPVYTLDLRNHGHSPHAEPHDYEHMAADVSRFFEDNGLKSGVNLLGHSMGGKVTMSLALNPELNKPLRSLISADVAPARATISPEFMQYTIGMKEIEDANVASKSEANKILQKYEESLPTRQFLLTNSITRPNKTLGFRIPLPILTSYITDIGSFPYPPPTPEHPGPTWNGPVLFIKGESSNYINRKNLPAAKAFFPEMKLETLDAGHWVHAERPREFVDLVEGFVKSIP